jgi:hypothetical protein
MVERFLTRAAWSLVAASLAAQALSAAARHGDPAKDTGCRAAVERRIVEWGAGAERYRDADGPFGAREWRLPTIDIGTWILLHEPVGAAPALARIDGRTTTRVTFDAQCHEAVTAVASRPGAPASQGSFTDDDARRLVGGEQRGIVFVWSPHMPLSVEAFHTVAEVARRMGMSFTPLRDPMSDAVYAATVAREADLPRGALRTFTSVELTFRQLSLHAPAVLVYDHGRFSGLAVPGYREAAGFEAAISERLRSISPSTSRRKTDKEP